jgi:endonuclease/exonuclease/phosphatase family metal-dependent hydrolase
MASQDVTLASFNLHGGLTAGGVGFDVTAACVAMDAGLVALQEAWRSDGSPDPLEEVAARLGAQLIRADLAVSTTREQLHIGTDSARGQWGLALLTTWPVVASGLAELGRAPGDAISRAAQLITVRAPGGGLLRIVNAHLTHRLTSPVQLVRLLRILRADAGVPTVIAGDLNMPWPVTGLAAGYDWAVRGRTFPASSPRVQLDHILTGAGITSHGGEVLPPAGSDHLPVRATLRLTSA